MGVIRKTKSVNAVLKAFEASKTPMSTLELVHKFRSDMNKTTVYRILERLEDEGLLHSFLGKDGIRWYAECHCLDSKPQDVHPHFQCNECGKTECLPIRIQLPDIPKYSTESASFLLMGRCSNCTS